MDMFAMKKYFTKIIAIIAIILLTVSDFLFVGTRLISYALDAYTTNNENVEFNAYFMNEANEKVNVVERNIDEGGKLYIDVAVKSDGYFNGKVSLNNSNFVFKRQEKNNYINEISEDTVTLNQVNAGDSFTIELEIEPKISYTINKTFLDSQTEIVLEGNYVDSIRAQKNKEIEIKGTKTAQVSWKSSKQTQAELSVSELTNNIYNVKDEEKRVVQLVINSKITANNYPVKNTEISLDVPENVQDVKVHTRSTEATNSEIKFDSSNYTFSKIDKTLNIRLSNEDFDTLSWNRNAQDIFVVTFILDKNENIDNQDIGVSSKITTYDDKQITETKSVHIEKNIDGIISGSISTGEESIYKGKIYTNEERQYYEKTVVNVDYLDVLNNIEIDLNESKFLLNEDEKDSNTVYKSIKINKEEFLKIFGEIGYISIKDAKGIVIANINKASETDENGNILINFTEATKSVQVLTSQPVMLGMLTIESTKAILNSNLERKVIDSLTAIKESVKINNNNFSKQIELKNTQMQTDLKINAPTISTLSDSEQMEIEATLVANDESKDLYKNPKVTFVFPNEISLVSVKYDVIYKNGLEIESDVNKKSENGQDIFEIQFKGEQEKYDYAEGTKIYLTAQVRPDKQASTKTCEVQMLCTNEYKEETKEISAGFNIEATTDLSTINLEENNDNSSQMQTAREPLRMQLSGANASSTEDNKTEIEITTKAVLGNKELLEGNEIFEDETVKYELTISNHTGKDYSNVAIKATQKNGYVWNLIERDVVNYYVSNEPEKQHFYDISDSNEINIGILETLKNGETYTYTYESTAYKLNNENIDGNVFYGTIDVKSENGTLNKNVETIKNEIKEAEINVKLVDKEPRENQKYCDEGLRTTLEIENVTANTQNNVDVQITLLNNLDLGNLDSFITIDPVSGDNVTINGSGITTDGKSFVRLNISSLEPEKPITIFVDPIISQIDGEEGLVKMVANVKTSSEKIYTSNILARTIYNNTHKLNLTQEVFSADGTKIDNDKDVLQDGDEIQIIATIENKEDTDFNTNVTYTVDSALEIQRAFIINGSQEEDVTEEIKTKASFETGEKVITANKKMQIKISAKVNSVNTMREEIQNNLTVLDTETMKMYPSLLKLSVNKYVPISNIEEELSYTYVDDREVKTITVGSKSDYTEVDEEGEIIQDDNNGNKPEENQDGYEIRGIVWLDSNEDGKREDDEEKIKDIKVAAINTSTKQFAQVTQTDANGEYVLNVPQGNYIVVFVYNDGLYKVTSYQAEGATNTQNSDVISKTITLDNEAITVGATDTLNISSNISYIDMGLIKKGSFDLELQKYVNKVTVTNSAGTKVYDQKENTALAKAEIKSKYLKDSLVVIEYKIKVKNIGEVEGYAKNIVDYLPSSLNFNSTLNTDWYKSGEYLYNTSLANTKIKPGETKELTLTVTKKMTESNTGLINNKAKIDSSYNEFGIEDKTDEKGSADVIISVSTGALITYITLTLSISATIFAIIYLINRRKLI